MDITMCNDDKCPLKTACVRYMGKKNDICQSYFTKSPRVGDKCDMFWGNEANFIMSQLYDIVNGKKHG